MKNILYNKPISGFLNFYIPTKFIDSYPTLFQKANLPIPNFKQIQYYYLLLNTIRYNSILKLWSHKQKQFYLKFQYANLHSKYLKNLLGKYYKRYIENLQTIGVINSDNKYNKKKKSFGYSLQDFSCYNNKNEMYLKEYFPKDYFSKITVQNKIINKRLSKIQVQVLQQKTFKQKQQKLLQQHPNYKYLVKHIQTFFHNYNYANALNFVNKNLSGLKHKKAIAYLNKIQNGDVDLQPYSTNGRLYNIITNSKKELIRYYNKNNFSSELCEIDLTAAQPTLLSIFYKKYSISETTKVINNKKYKWSQDAKNIYEILTKLYNETYNKKYTRERIKKRLITFFNQKIYYNKKNDLYPILKQYYPSVIKLLFAIKKTNHKYFSKELQKCESEIFIKQILIPFSKEHFILSKHDALIIRLEDYTYLQELIYKTFIANHIYNYQFKIKLLSSNKQISSDDIPTMLFNSMLTINSKGEGAGEYETNNNVISLETMLKELNILNAIDYNALQVA